MRFVVANAFRRSARRDEISHIYTSKYRTKSTQQQQHHAIFAVASCAVNRAASALCSAIYLVVRRIIINIIITRGGYTRAKHHR